MMAKIRESTVKGFRAPQAVPSPAHMPSPVIVADEAVVHKNGQQHTLHTQTDVKQGRVAAHIGQGGKAYGRAATPTHSASVPQPMEQRSTNWCCSGVSCFIAEEAVQHIMQRTQTQGLLQHC